MVNWVHQFLIVCLSYIAFHLPVFFILLMIVHIFSRAHDIKDLIQEKVFKEVEDGDDTDHDDWIRKVAYAANELTE